MFHGYHHIGLKVTDGEKSLAFYTQGLGGKETFRFPMGDSGKIIYLVDLGGGAVVEIIPGGWEAAESNARWAHIALNTGDCKAAFDKAVQAGAKPRIEPQDVMLGDMAVCNAFVTGPDGEDIEFFQVK